MGIGHMYDYYRNQIKPALESKLEEFRLLGYETVTEDELWNFLIRKRWKKPEEDKKLYEIVQDILAVKVSDYMGFAAIEAYKNPEFSLKDERDWKELLK
ncbi:post-transcriptional regulator [Neobacillus terrae]|uniref:post-transcriptional regulator n=1 Tax=Neobacillus terrae TaxID=3034837 RepID=UPI001409C60E|nr:post-transcriptional regulator [Neobacillus terrae]NHM30444.1 post-transcriptional regulator [Neobacillus terrae]